MEDKVGESSRQRPRRAFDKPVRGPAFDTPPKRVPKQKLLVAIDFGTTYTGVAYAFAETGTEYKLEQIEPITNVVKS